METEIELTEIENQKFAEFVIFLEYNWFLSKISKKLLISPKFQKVSQLHNHANTLLSKIKVMEDHLYQAPMQSKAFKAEEEKALAKML